MRRFWQIVTMAALFSASTALASEVVFVDVQEVLKNFYKTKLATDQIQQQSDDIEVEVQEMENEIVDMKDVIEALRKDSRDASLSEEIRVTKREELEEKLVELQKKEQDKNEFAKLRKDQLEQQQKRMLMKLLDEVREAIVKYAKDKGYDGVIDRSIQTQFRTPMVIFVHPNADITGNVLAQLNTGELETEEKAEPAKK